jgi:hypothetical protein
MLPQLIEFDNKRVVVRKHHIKNSSLKRLEKGYMTVWDIEKSDVLSSIIYSYENRAKKFNFPVFLIVNDITRLLIFDKAV